MRKVLKITLLSLGTLLGLGVIGVLVLFVLYDRNLYVPAEGPPPEIAIRGGTLFSGADERPVANPGIVIRDGRIACIGPACATGADAVEIDATGLAVTPGLIDLHVHFMAMTADNAELSMPGIVWNMARLRPDVRRKLLEAGVTSIREAGGPQDVLLELKADLENGELEGPRLFTVGAMFTAPGGHPTRGGNDPNDLGFGGDMAFQSNDPEAVRREVERQAERGVDGVKAVFHGSTSETGQVLLPTLSAETLAAIIETARANDLWVAVHVGPGDEAGRAAELGATTVEHGVRAGNLVDEPTVERLVAADVVYVPTLGREPQGHLNIPALSAAGVTIGVGTDTNNPEMSYGESYHLELARLVEAGMSPAAVLLAATRNSAKGIHAADRLGTIETGRLADILLVDGEPWREIGDLRQVVAVIKGGRVVVDRRSSDD